MQWNAKRRNARSELRKSSASAFLNNLIKQFRTCLSELFKLLNRLGVMIIVIKCNLQKQQTTFYHRSIHLQTLQ